MKKGSSWWGNPAQILKSMEKTVVELFAGARGLREQGFVGRTEEYWTFEQKHEAAQYSLSMALRQRLE